MQPKMTLGKTEVCLNFVSWTTAVLYSLYNFYMACDVFKKQEDIYNDFSPGWSILHRRKDSADIEWQTILHLLHHLIYWCLAHALISHCILYNLKDNTCKNIQCFQIILSFLFIMCNLPFLLVLMCIIQPLLFRLCYVLQNSIIMWICWLMCLFVITTLKFTDLSEYLPRLNENDIYLTFTCMFWMNLKCFSYFTDKFKQGKKFACENDINSYDKQLEIVDVDDLEYMAYCFYLPTLVGGPFLSFDDYVGSLGRHGFKSSQKNKVLKLGIDLLRVGCWMLFTEFALHFIYVNPMLYQIEHVRGFNSWTFYGYGYAMGQYFHLKYVVLYGFSLAFAQFDGISHLKRPKCIGRIHVYSDMWKHFDRGFYIFLVRYLYIPLMRGRKTFYRQVFASMACFLFVFVWHGIATCILIWTMINLFTVTLEKCFQLLQDSQIGVNMFKWLDLTDQWRQRLHAIIASPLLALSAMSNSYFFAGKEVGDAFFTQFFASDLSTKLTLFFLLYFCCQVSIEVKKWEQSSCSRRDNAD